MQGLLKISQQTLWQILGKVVTSLSTLIILGLVARNYGETGTGVFTLALTYLAIFYLLADFGFNAHILQKTGNLQSEVEDQWVRLLGARILWSILLVIIALGLLPTFPFATADFSKAVTLGSLAIVFYAVFVTSSLIFQSRLRYDLAAASIAIGSLFWLVIVMLFIKLKLGVPFLVLSHSISWIIIALVSFLLLKKLIKKLDIKFDARFIKRLFKNSWPIAGTLVLNVIYFRVDAFILSSIKGISEVGIYNVAYQVFQSILVLPTFVMNSFYPMMLESLTMEMARFKRQIKLTFGGLMVVSTLASLSIFVLSPLVIKLITGGGFEGSITSLQILSLGFPAYFLSALLMWVMVAKKMYNKMLLVYGLGLVFNVAANLLFIPHYSYLAASWITVISEYLILGMQVVTLRFIK